MRGGVGQARALGEGNGLGASRDGRKTVLEEERRPPVTSKAGQCPLLTDSAVAQTKSTAAIHPQRVPHSATCIARDAQRRGIAAG